MPQCSTCTVGPGKFEGEDALAYLAYLSALHGDADATTYHPRPKDWFRRPFNFDADDDHVSAALDYGYCTDCLQGALKDESFGLSLYEDDNGFVYLTRFATEEEYDKAFGEAEDEQDKSFEQELGDG